MKKIRQRFNSAIMAFMYGDKCTCGDNDGCYICSKEFRLYPYVRRWMLYGELGWLDGDQI